MKVFKVKDHIESYYLVYNLVSANSKEEALEIANKIMYGTVDEEDVIEIPNLEYNSKYPSVIFTLGENVRNEYFNS